MNGLTVTSAAGVVSIRLDRPDQRNALTTALLDDLRAALRAIADDATARAVVVSGAGPAFCAGADLAEIPPDAPADAGIRRVRLVAEVASLLRQLPQPTIAAVHGAAVGAGWGLALMCDTCFVSSDATFSLPEVPKGFRLPSVIIQRLVEVTGPVRAADLVLSGRRLCATDAVAAGIAARVLELDDLHATATEVASTLASRRRDRVLAATTALRTRSTSTVHPAAEFTWTEEGEG
jgi:enoyl-CoA hydratase/carnithine racemase